MILVDRYAAGRSRAPHRFLKECIAMGSKMLNLGFDMRLLNLGCGSTFHPSWINVDIISTSPHVKGCDLRKPLPFADGAFDAVYHSHVLEHFSREDGRRFMTEAVRVLRKGGVIRVVVPDLEQIARLYLGVLEKALQDDVRAQRDYEWMMIELYDQTVRTSSGGEMRKYIRDGGIEDLGFVRARVGVEADKLLSQGSETRSHGFARLREKVSGKRIGDWGRFLRIAAAKAAVRALGGPESAVSYREGLFRNSGEVHKWMYDRYSLGKLLEEVGASSVKTCRADESLIANFERFELDSVNGRPRKPDSLFIEAIKV